jgi:hypothetical protein
LIFNNGDIATVIHQAVMSSCSTILSPDLNARNEISCGVFFSAIGAIQSLPSKRGSYDFMVLQIHEYFNKENVSYDISVFWAEDSKRFVNVVPKLSINTTIFISGMMDIEEGKGEIQILFILFILW